MTPEVWKLLSETQNIDHLRVPFTGGHMAIMEAEAMEDETLANAQEWIGVEFEVALDSGSTDNVCHEGDAPGYTVEASAGSKRSEVRDWRWQQNR